MKLSSIVATYFAGVSAVTSPITDVAMREQIAQRGALASQRRMMLNGYRRPRPNRERKRGKAIYASTMFKQIEQAQKAARTFAQMMKIVNSYKY